MNTPPGDPALESDPMASVQRAFYCGDLAGAIRVAQTSLARLVSAPDDLRAQGARRTLPRPQPGRRQQHGIFVRDGARWRCCRTAAWNWWSP